MSYSTVSELYNDVQLYMNRNEASIVNKIPMWVNMAEDELDRRLRHPANEALVEYQVIKGQRQIPAPANLAELKFIRVPDADRILYRRSIETLFDLPIGDDYPTGFASVSNQYVLNFEAKQDFLVEYCFYMVPDKLSNQNASNTYLTLCGDLLLYLTLSEGFSYDMNLEDSAYFRQKAEKVLADLEEQIKKEERSGSTLVTFASADALSNYF